MNDIVVLLTMYAVSSSANSTVSIELLQSVDFCVPLLPIPLDFGT